ncbi:hypothetical protein CC_2256 [Caulobacter vibrioides CB15]|uniref:Uncharacterized protein n=1 Tax=Caulobacter vibrioides (strain ATCC 19089 / CIP 103742 / CB 15) TaxID=190650 RepID=Q9A639_CAUVC|nr:hypothetical protein CC_2256 [Caulobacter vibrioides CB15]
MSCSGSFRLRELQGHAVALPDRIIFGMVETRLGRLAARRRQARGRQGPDPEGMVLGVLGIGVDLAGRDQDEAGLLGHLDDVVLLDIAILGQHVLDASRLPAMFLDPQNPAGLERCKRVLEGLLGDAAGHPVMQIAQEQHEIGAARRRDGPAGRAEGRKGHLAIDLLFLGQLAAVAVDDRGGRRVSGASRLQHGFIELAAGVGQERRQDVGVPACSRPELDHGLAGLELPEFQAFDRMTPNVARAVGRRTPVSRHRRLDRVRPGLGGGLGLHLRRVVLFPARRQSQGADARHQASPRPELNRNHHSPTARKSLAADLGESQAGLRKRRVIRSLSPIASYLLRSKLGSAGWPPGAVRFTGGRVQTPNGWSLVSFGLALISD